MKVISGASVYVEGCGLVKEPLYFDGTVRAIGGAMPADKIELPEGAVVLPGFIDTHIHGAADAEPMDGNVPACRKVARALVKEGTTGFLATTMTESPERINAAMTAVREYRANPDAAGAALLGVHLEGPFIALKFKGAQPEKYVAAPDVSVFDAYNEKSGNTIRIVTLAPECEGAEVLIRHLKEVGVTPSVGHSAAGVASIEKAIGEGLCGVTHTYNAQSPLHHREIGVVGSAMLFDELNCELIADTIHVSVPAMKLLVKNKPHDKLTLITDSMRAKGIPDGISSLGGQTVIVKDGQARLEDGTLAGSVLKMCDAVKNMVTKVGVSVTDASDFASANPAKKIGVFDTVGSIRVGKHADFAILSKDLDLIMTVKDGEVVYSAL